MAIQRITNSLLYGLSTDSKPTNYATNTVWYEVDTGNIYIYNGTSWILNDGASKTETLTNKTMSGSSNTFTNIPSTALPSSVAYTNVVNGWSTIQYFPSSSLAVLNPAGTFGYPFIGSAITASRNITLPLLTGNDQMTCDANTTTLTNKTLTSPKISTISNTGTLTLPTSTDTLMGRATTDTLTNKTFNISSTGNQLTTSSAAAGDILYYNGSNYTNLGLGTSGNVLTAGASAPSWSPPPSSGGWSGPLPYVFPDTTTTYTNVGSLTADGTGLISIGNMARNSVTGTATQKSDLATTEGLYYNIATASTNTFTGFSCNTTVSPYWISTDSIPSMVFRMRWPTASSSLRFALGLNSSTSFTSDTISPASGYSLMIGKRSTDTNFMAITNNGGTATYTSLGTAVTANTWYTLSFTTPSTSGPASFYINGTLAGTVSTGYPGSGGMMAWLFGINSTSGTQSMDMHYIILRKAF